MTARTDLSEQLQEVPGTGKLGGLCCFFFFGGGRMSGAMLRSF